jgi:hypothetical protein
LTEEVPSRKQAISKLFRKGLILLPWLLLAAAMILSSSGFPCKPLLPYEPNESLHRNLTVSVSVSADDNRAVSMMTHKTILQQETTSSDTDIYPFGRSWSTKQKNAIIVTTLALFVVIAIVCVILFLASTDAAISKPF